MLHNRKGFTLAELLIVVAIIATLVSIAVLEYTSMLERSREAADVSNVRSALSEIINHYISEQEILTKTIPVEQRQEGWQTEPTPTIAVYGAGAVSFEAKITGEYTVTVEVEPGTETLIPKIS